MEFSCFVLIHGPVKTNYIFDLKNTLTYAKYLLATDLHEDFILQTNLKPKVKYKEGQLYLIVTKSKCLVRSSGSTSNGYAMTTTDISMDQ